MKRVLSIYIAGLLALIICGSVLFKTSANQEMPAASAGITEEGGVVALAQVLLEMTSPFTVMCVAARPDDADFGTLAYYHHKFGARAVAVFATRSESESLNSNLEATARKTGEALKRAHAVGADAYFLNLRDFGTTRSADEAFRIWDRDKALSQMIQAIRFFRPDVIITGQLADGQQQAVWQLLNDAFDAAAGSKQVAGTNTEAWQTKRIFQRVEGFAEVMVNLNEYDSMRGRTYAETAGKASGERIAYKLVRSASGEVLSPGSTLLSGLLLSEKVRRSIEPPSVNGQLITESVVAGDNLLLALNDKLLEKRAEGSFADLKTRYGVDYFRVAQFIDKLERAIALVMGVRFTIRLPDKVIAQGEPLRASLDFYNGGTQTQTIGFHWFEALNNPASLKTSEVIIVAPSDSARQQISYETRDMALTLPRTEKTAEEHYYQTSRFDFSPQPFGVVLQAYAEISLGQTTINVPAIAKFDIAPPIEIEASPPVAFIKDWSQTKDVEFTVRVRNRKHSPLQGALWVVPLALESNDYEPVHISLLQKDEEAIVKLKLKLPVLKPPLATDILLELRREKPAPPDPLVSTRVSVKLLDYEVAPDSEVGYFANDNSPLLAALASLGVECERLSADDLKKSEHGDKATTCGNLSRFDTVLIDALAYSPELAARRDCLLDYVKGGGNLVVFYQRPNFWTSIFSRNIFAPFPLTLSSGQVTDENAAVIILSQEHPLLTKPNQITAKDFEGWAQDRARFVPKSWAEDFTPLLESADKEGMAQRGLLLFARYGEGTFIFTSLDLPRQFANLNGGALRLLANFISLPKALKQEKAK